MITLKYINDEVGENCMKDVSDVLVNISSDLIQQSTEICILPKESSKSIKGNAIVYITGYLLKKTLLQHSCDICREYLKLNDLEENANYSGPGLGNAAMDNDIDNDILISLVEAKPVLWDKTMDGSKIEMLLEMHGEKYAAL
nr:unnamed protein product [Callosobruchus chinensis]